MECDRVLIPEACHQDSINSASSCRMVSSVRKKWKEMEDSGGGANCVIINRSANNINSKKPNQTSTKRTRHLLSLFVLLFLVDFAHCDLPPHPHDGANTNPYNQPAPEGTPSAHEIERLLRDRGFTGGIHPQHTTQYERLRRVMNGACNHRRPRVIIRPGSTYDVSVAVKVAR